MNGYPKKVDKNQIKKNSNIKTFLNPPKKCILKPKPLLTKNSIKIINRNFGKEIKNLRHLTEEHLLFNNKKRHRKKMN